MNNIIFIFCIIVVLFTIISVVIVLISTYPPEFIVKRFFQKIYGEFRLSL